MAYQIVLKKSGTVMLMEDYELREMAGNLLNKVVPLKDMEAFNSDPDSWSYVPIYVDEKNEIVSLLDKCREFNVHSQKWSKPLKPHIPKNTQDHLKQAIDLTMERLETWLPKSWAELVKELRYEMKVAYDKFINVRKNYFGLNEISRGNEGSELTKSDIARDIQDYVKYGINLSLQFFTQQISKRWNRKIAIHFEMLARELEGLNVQNEDELGRLAEDVSLYKQCMLDFADNSARGLEESSSKAYMMLRQKGGVPFSDLIERKKNELGFAYLFQNLKDTQQDEVYQGIINELDGENASKVQFVDFLFGEGRDDDDIHTHLLVFIRLKDLILGKILGNNYISISCK